MRIDMDDNSESLRQALARTIDAIKGGTISLRELIDLIGGQGMLVLCALLSIPFLIPVSIPGVSTVFGAAIILISIAITTNRKPWLPKRILDRRLSAEKLVPALRKGLGIVDRIGRFLRPRFNALTDGAVVNRLNGLGLTLGGVLLLFPLGLVPFSNTLPGLAILSMSMGIAQRDGMFVLVGYGWLVATIVYFAVLGYVAFAAGQGLASMVGG